jgi:parvulin-like peptidyl-prolyl isomerase
VRAAALCGALLLTLLQSSAVASVAARIDGQALHALSVDAAWQAALATDAKARRAAALDTLIANRLLAEAARKRFGEAALSAGQRVAFAREVGFDDQLTSTLRTLYGAQIDSELAQLVGGIDGMIRGQAPPGQAALDAVFGEPNRLRLDATLDAAQLERARALVLLRYALPHGGAEGALTVADVYQRQNVQGRVAMFARDMPFMLQQAKQRVAALYVQDWGRRRFGADAVADLRRTLAEQADVQALMRMHGAGEDAHADSVLLDQLARQVTAAQVGDYYRRHRDQFMRIERVRGRHIRLPDESTAQAVAAQLAAGASFAELARRHSIATDAASGGALGWVRHEGTPGWLAQLLFTYPAGQASPPVRTPAGPDDKAPWEIVLVERREQGYQAADSESVRHVASRAIARQSALAQLQALRKDLLRKARVEIMPGNGSVGAAP